MKLKIILLGLMIVAFGASGGANAYNLTTADLKIVDSLSQRFETIIQKGGEDFRPKIMSALEVLSKKPGLDERISLIFVNLSKAVDNNRYTSNCTDKENGGDYRISGNFSKDDKFVYYKQYCLGEHGGLARGNGDYLETTNGYFYKSKKINTVGSFGFEAGNEAYPKDQAYAYFEGEVVSSDIENFEELQVTNNLGYKGGSYYAKDSQNVYFRGEVIDSADFDSFVAVDQKTAKDKNCKYREAEAYSCSSVSTTSVTASTITTTETEELINIGYGLYKGDGKFYNSNGKYKNQIYGIDFDTFEWVQSTLVGNLPENTWNFFDIFKDKNGVYKFKRDISGYPSNFEKISWADPNNFKILNFGDSAVFLISNDKVYKYNGNKTEFELIDGINSNGFVYINSFYIKDFQNVYYSSNGYHGNYSKLEGIDAETFSIVPIGIIANYNITKDKNNVYSQNNIFIEGSDTASFKIVGYAEGNIYAKDKNNVYRSGLLNVIKGVDVASFQIIIDGQNTIIKDKNHIYDGTINYEGYMNIVN